MAAPIVSSITICNNALLKVGADIISDLNATSRPAIVCNAIYEYIRDEVMGSAPWRFALKRAVLSPNGTTPPFEYDYTYDLPSDCLRLLTVEHPVSGYVVEANQILSNDDTLNAKYIFRNTDESSWDARFGEAFSWRLSIELAMALAESIPLMQEMEKGYENSLAQARAMNAVQGSGVHLVADLWSGARRGYRYWRKSEGQGDDGPVYGP